MALVIMIALIGVGVALITVAGALTLSGAARVAMGEGRQHSLHAPGVALALGGELIAVALLVGWRAGGRRGEEECEDHGPPAG